MAHVEIYTTQSCPYCIQAKRLLTKKGVQYVEYSIERDSAKRQEMEERSQRRTVPQIFINGAHVGGCDDLYDLEGDEKLDAMLGLE